MNGQTIAILESRLGSEMAGLIERRGGRTLLAPALREVPDTDAGQILRFIDDLEQRGFERCGQLGAQRVLYGHGSTLRMRPASVKRNTLTIVQQPPY